MKTVAIHWFRKGLRLHDNPAFCSAISNATFVIPLFILDPFFVKNSNVGVNRWAFLLQSLQNLDESLKSLNSSLLVFRGKPISVLEDLFEILQKNDMAVELYFESDTEPYAKVRDEEISKLCFRKGVRIISHVSHTLYDPTLVIKANKGNVPISYQSFCKVLCEKMPIIDSIFETPTLCPPIGAEIVDFIEKYTSGFSYSAFTLPIFKEIRKDVIEPKILYPGGETEALKRLTDFIKQKEKVLKFEKPNTNPAAFEPASTTILSPYLKMGCLSVRKFYLELQGVYKNSKHTEPPVSLLGQLLWREFFYTCGYGIANFDRISGNSICKQITWRSDENVNSDLNKWAYGQTGYPWIDAIMTQLRTEGWIHHLARHSVACFLTRGDLYISWEQGAQVFEELLLDADWSLNTGNWLWLSASAFFHQYFRVYSPVAFPKKYMPISAKYVRKYIPILKKFPDKFIFEPWKASLIVQRSSGCIVGKEYPLPMVDHEVISKLNISKMKMAYESCAEKSGAKRKHSG